MTELPLTLMVLSRITVLVLGLAITGYAFRAYRINRTDYLLKAALGFGIVTVGVFLEGALYHAAGFDLIMVHAIESVVVSSGFLVILASLR